MASEIIKKDYVDLWGEKPPDAEPQEPNLQQVQQMKEEADEQMEKLFFKGKLLALKRERRSIDRQRKFFIDSQKVGCTSEISFRMYVTCMEKSMLKTVCATKRNGLPSL